MILSEKLKSQIALLPDAPGVYLMKDASDAIIYIGKAKSLKKRVSQYFLRPQEGKVLAMVTHVDHFDFILVHNEKEAFILEMNLIQTHYPRYNIMMMDNSHYPYIAVRKDDARLTLTRNTKDKRNFYFGPFPNGGDAKRTIQILDAIYPTRKCRTLPKKPCLYYSLHQCMAPCIHSISEERYADLYAKVKRFLDGNTEEAIALLKERMVKAAEEMRYEDAGEYKKMIDAIRATTAKQTAEINNDKTSRDIIGYAEREGYRSVAILTYRRGMLLGKQTQVFGAFGDIEEQLAEFLASYYAANQAPSEILCRVPGIAEELAAYDEAIKVVAPKEGRLADLVDMAALNARQGLDAHFMSARLEDDKLGLLNELGDLLNIGTPYRIELFDNSHLQGAEAVGALVVFVNGMPNKKMYRKYRLAEENAGDDYHSMKEVAYRRYNRLKEEGQPFPELLLVDGGLPQIHAALEGLDAADVTLNVFGLYKNDKHQTEGLIDRDGNTYPLDAKSPLFFLLMRMQDEVHRFAITYHKERRSKAMTRSIYDGIPGIGEKRKEQLRKHYPTLEDLKRASVEELTQILTKDIAASLYAAIHEEQA